MRHHFVYLHGFASGPQSRKARFFAEKFLALNASLELPDLAAGDFEHLTIGGQLAVVEALLQNEPATLIGSSMGGYLAALYASRHPEVRRLVLLAPAFHFTRAWEETVGAEALKQWQRTGSHLVYHYGEAKMRALDYRIVEESKQWDPAPAFVQPGHIFHGLEDKVVPVAPSRFYISNHPHLELTTLPSGHELTDVLELIWNAAAKELLSDVPFQSASTASPSILYET